MAAPNDVLILRFTYADEDRHDVPFQRAADVVFAVRDFCDAAIRPFERTSREEKTRAVELVLVANPRRGSLELVFQLSMVASIDLNPGLLEQLATAAREGLAVGADIATIASFLLVLCFSPNGVFARKTGQSRRSAAPTPEERVVERMAPSVEDAVVDHVEAIVRAASATQCKRVEAEVRDLGSVQLVPDVYRRSAALIGRRLPQHNKPSVSLVTLDDHPSVKAVAASNGKLVPLLLAHTSDGNPLVLAWNRPDEPPPIGKPFEVKGSWLDDIQAFLPSEDVPLAFESVRGIYVVNQWRESWR